MVHLLMSDFWKAFNKKEKLLITARLLTGVYSSDVRGIVGRLHWFGGSLSCSPKVKFQRKLKNVHRKCLLSFRQCLTQLQTRDPEPCIAPH